MSFEPTGAGGAADPLAQALGFVNWVMPPATMSTAATLTSQVGYAAAIWLPSGTATGVALQVATAGTSTVPTGFFVGLMSRTTMLCQSSNLNASAALTTTGIQQFPFSASFVVPTPGLYFVLILQNGAFAGTAVQIASGGTAMTGLSGQPMIVADIGTALTVPPANGAAVTFSGTARTGRWVAVY